MITWLMQRRRNHTRKVVAVKKSTKKAEIEAVGGHGGNNLITSPSEYLLKSRISFIIQYTSIQSAGY
jgi:hypothetical protein